jgi:hypothetical protein
MKKLIYFTLLVGALGFQQMNGIICWQRILFSRTIDIISRAEADFLRTNPQQRLRIHAESPDVYISAIEDTGFSRNEIQTRLVPNSTEVAFNVYSPNGYEEDKDGFIHRKTYLYKRSICDPELYRKVEDTLSKLPTNLTTIVNNSLAPVDFTDDIYNRITKKLEEEDVRHFLYE